MLQLMVMKNFFPVNVGLSVMHNVIYAVLLGTTVRAEALKFYWSVLKNNQSVRLTVNRHMNNTYSDRSYDLRKHESILRGLWLTTIVGGASILWRHKIIWLHLREGKTYKEIKKKKTLDGFLSLYDGCVQALPTHISVQSTCKSACTIIWPL